MVKNEVRKVFRSCPKCDVVIKVIWYLTPIVIYNSILLWGKSIDVNARDEKGSTPLHLAVNRRDLDLIKLLLGKGANVNAKDNRGNTPLECAFNNTYSYNVQTDSRIKMNIAKELIENGASIDIRNDNCRLS